MNSALRRRLQTTLAAIPLLVLAACVDGTGEILPPPELSAPRAAATAPPPPPLIPLPPPKAQDLLGLAADEVTSRLGPAGFSRQEQSAQVWHYNGNGCQLWLFLYEDAPGGIYRVAHVEEHSTAEGAGTADSNRCYASLLP